MPIRTHRGRAAVYRRFWGWPLRSPKHLAIAVIGLALVATAIGQFLPAPPPSGPRDYSQERKYITQEPVQPAPQIKPSPPSISVPLGTPPPAPPSPEGLSVVESWARSFVNHPPGTKQQQWLDRLRPYTTDEFLPVMADVDPANVSATSVTGPVRAEGSTATAMRVRVPTDSGDILVSVISTAQGWRVAEYNKVG